MKKWAFFLLALILVSPLRADTLTPAQQYNEKARKIISQCSRVYVSYMFVDYQMGVGTLSLGKVGLTPQNATLLANVITVDQKVTDPPPITPSDRWLEFTFFNSKGSVGVANSKLSGPDGNIILQNWNPHGSDYTLTPQSSKALRDWVLKQPQLAKKFPH